MPIYLSAQDIVSLAPTHEEIEAAIVETFTNQSDAINIPRAEYGDLETARFLAFPSILKSEHAVGLKWLAMPQGGYRGPGGRLSALLLVNDAASGALQGILDAEWITSIRTAMVSLIAARTLAKPASTVISFIGCGHQAELHLQLFGKAFPLETVMVSGRSQASIDRFTKMARDMGFRIVVADSKQSCVREADIVISSISSASATDDRCDTNGLKRDCFVSHVDLGRAFDWSHGSSFRLFVDDVAQYQSLCDEGRLPRSKDGPVALSAAMSAGTAAFASSNVPIGFVPTGLGVADLALGRLLLKKALSTGQGVSLQ